MSSVEQQVLSIVDKWMDGYDFLGAGDRASERAAEKEWKSDREAIIAALREQPEARGVVAYIYKERYGHDDSAWIERINRTLPAWEHKDVQPLYAAPPSAPVGMTELIHKWERKGVAFNRGMQDVDAALSRVCEEFVHDLRLLTQQSAAVDEAMANLRDAILRNDGLTRKNTLAAFRAVEDALATQHQEPTT